MTVAYTFLPRKTIPYLSNYISLKKKSSSEIAMFHSIIFVGNYI